MMSKVWQICYAPQGNFFLGCIVIVGQRIDSNRVICVVKLSMVCLLDTMFMQDETEYIVPESHTTEPAKHQSSIQSKAMEGFRKYSTTSSRNRRRKVISSRV